MTLGSGVKVEVPGVYLLFPDFCIHAQSIYQRTHPHQLRSFLVRWVGCHRSFRRSILCTFFTNKEKAKPLMKRQAVRSIRTNGNKKQRKKKGKEQQGAQEQTRSFINDERRPSLLWPSPSLPHPLHPSYSAMLLLDPTLRPSHDHLMPRNHPPVAFAVSHRADSIETDRKLH